jgi:hypothetical protein
MSLGADAPDVIIAVQQASVGTAAANINPSVLDVPFYVSNSGANAAYLYLGASAAATLSNGFCIPAGTALPMKITFPSKNKAGAAQFLSAIAATATTLSFFICES